MATHGWRSPRALSAQIFSDFASFNYYQLLRLLRRWLAQNPDAHAEPPRAALGLAGQGDAQAEACDRRLRISADLSAGFAVAEVTALEPNGRDGSLRLSSPNFCVSGAAGPLPAPYLDWLQSQLRNGQRAMADFIDLFSRRVHLMRWRIKSRLHPGLHDRDPDQCDYAEYLAAIIGLSDPGVLEALPLPRRALLALAGLLADGRRSQPALCQALSVFLDAPVRMDALTGRWLRLSDDSVNVLGRTNSRLGRDLSLGRRIFDPQAAVTLHVGPLPFARVQALLPGARDHGLLRGLLRLLGERRFDVCMVLHLDGAGIPPAQLGGARLGWTAGIDGGRAVRFWLPAHESNDDWLPALGGIA